MAAKKQSAKKTATKTANKKIAQPTALRPFFSTAIDNIVHFGDTDIFPFPMENFVLLDSKVEALDLLDAMHRDFEGFFNRFPPVHYSTLAPVGYQGFRWATQLDPIWNAYLLGVVISIGAKIEGARLPTSAGAIFSYRFKYSSGDKTLFDPAIGWLQFQQRSRELAEHSNFVLQCDISDFYPRVYHHRLENALNRVAARDDAPARIMSLLQHFARNASYSLPVGGPAARLLSELVLDSTDRLLASNGVKFCRFADDYRIFTSTQVEAYKALVFLSEKLLKNEGLSLQKAKTKILSRAEFLQLTQIESGDAGDDNSLTQTARFMRLRLHFDPYSPTADRDYELLKKEISQFDILAMLRSEIGKSHIDIALTRRLLQAAKHMGPKERESVTISLLAAADTLAPIYPQVLTFIKACFENLSNPAQQQVLDFLRKQLHEDTSATALDLNVAYMIRVLAEERSPESEALLIQLFQRSSSPLVRRDIIYVLAKWGATYWLSDVRNDFQSLHAAERRAFIIGSFSLTDEGRHWRKHTKDHFSPFETILTNWYAKRTQVPSWRIPI